MGIFRSGRCGRPACAETAQNHIRSHFGFGSQFAALILLHLLVAEMASAGTSLPAVRRQDPTNPPPGGWPSTGLEKYTTCPACGVYEDGPKKGLSKSWSYIWRLHRQPICGCKRLWPDEAYASFDCERRLRYYVLNAAEDLGSRAAEALVIEEINEARRLGTAVCSQNVVIQKYRPPFQLSSLN